jgi:FkbM family methyltransferase
MIRVLTYIFRHNSFPAAISHLFQAFFFQLYKRTTGGVVTKRIFNGKQLFLFPNCNVSTFFVYTDQPDRNEITKLRQILKPGDVFLDIGANVGSYSVSLMDITRDIIAFEPHPFTANRCRMNFLLNGMPADAVKETALSSGNGEVYFTDKGHSSTVNSISKEGEGIRVAMQTLDHFISHSPALTPERGYALKIDVEGFEKDVLNGAAVFLKDWNIKGMILECFEPAEIFPILERAGFRHFEKCSENNYFITR